MPTATRTPDFDSCSDSGGCQLGDADFQLRNTQFVGSAGGIVWRAFNDETPTLEFINFIDCESFSGVGGACDLTGGVQILIGICASNCRAKVGGFAMMSRPKPKSIVTNCGVSESQATVKAGAFALQTTIGISLENVNISGCSAPSAAAIAMGVPQVIDFVTIQKWSGSFAVGGQDSAVNCLFFNSTFAAIRGDVFAAVGCRFSKVGPFEGFVTVNKCSFAGADTLGGMNAGGNLFNAEVQKPEGGRCPTPKISPLVQSPYARRRKILQGGLFASVILMLA
jgi:hypothetical protein